MSELKAWEPTWRESAASGLQSLLEKAGIDRYQARKLAQTVTGGESSNLGGMGLLDATPAGWGMGVQEGGLMTGRGVGKVSRGDYGGGVMDIGMGLLTGAGNAAPLVAAGVKAAPAVARAAIKGGENLAAPRTLKPETGAIVWHGSPHKFDKFDSSKIGTGEGAQSYGHGLYLADSPGVADSYRATLSDNAFSIGGKQVLGPTTRYAHPNPNASRDGLSMPEKMATYALDSAVKGKSADPSRDAIAHLKKYGKGNPHAQDAMALVKQWADEGAGLEAGNLYKADLPDDKIAKMLDWDAPLSKQPAEVRAFMKQQGLSDKYLKQTAGGISQRGDTGTGLWGSLINEGMTKAEASEALRKAGIPGIKYLDGTSRTAGQGTRNYVVFPGEESAVKILERNGVGLLDEAPPMPALLNQGMSRGQRGAIDIGALESSFPSVDFSLSQRGNVATLNKVKVPKAEQGQGQGTAFMKALTDAADADKTMLTLSPSADFGGSKARLIEFYKRFGFVPNSGRNIDYAISESMFREPK